MTRSNGRSLTLEGDGSGRLILSGSNDYGGGTDVAAGTLIVTSNTALTDGTSLTVGAGGTFIFDPSAVAATVVSTQDIHVVAAVPEPGTLVLLAAGLVPEPRRHMEEKGPTMIIYLAGSGAGWPSGGSTRNSPESWNVATCPWR